MLFLIFVFNMVKKIAVGVIESSPKAKTSKHLQPKNQPVSMEDPEDEEFNEDQFMRRNRNANSNPSSSGKSLLESSKSMVEPFIKFANSAPNPCPRLDQTN
jgi:hypothetical protein